MANSRNLTKALAVTTALVSVFSGACATRSANPGGVASKPIPEDAVCTTTTGARNGTSVSILGVVGLGGNVYGDNQGYQQTCVDREVLEHEKEMQELRNQRINRRGNVTDGVPTPGEVLWDAGRRRMGL